MFLLSQNAKALVSQRSSKAVTTMATQLIQLPEVEKLSPLVIRILGGNPGKVIPLHVNKNQNFTHHDGIVHSTR
jgi:hypothetical protein